MKLRRTRPNQDDQRLSLFYRKNRAEIDAGRIPTRYRRVAECISTDSVLEMGSAEGTLGSMVARVGTRYLGIESNPARHIEAVTRATQLGAPGAHALLFGDLRDHLLLLNDYETFVGMRCIYYLRDDITRVFDQVCSSVKEIVLVGNAEREERYLAGHRGSLGEFERFATLDGMTELVTERGFVVSRSDRGTPRLEDPLVVAHAPH